MKKKLQSILGQHIYIGYVLEASASHEASEASYDDMKVVGRIRIADEPKAIGDDLNDTPFDCNGNIYNGEEIELEQGDRIIIIKG